MAKSVKLADIAEKFGVSVVTVSKALSDQKGVSEDMRSKIKELAQEMGYVSPSAAKIQNEKKSYTVGVIVSSRYFDHTQSFYWLMYQELATRALSKNCFTMLEVVQEDMERSNSIPKLLEGERVNGLIVIGLMKEEYIKSISENTKVPIVYLDFYCNNFQDNAIVADNFFGMYQVTNYLCELGHKKIAYVGTLFSTNSITDRYFGYCKALYEHGIEIRKDYVINDRFEDTGMKQGFVYTLPEDMPTAFACNCDVTAIEIIEELKKMGLRVPQDISVVGFDNYAITNTEEIKLTTFAVDLKEMVGKALKILVMKMSGEYVGKGVSVIEGKMIIGETVKKI